MSEINSHENEVLNNKRLANNTLSLYVRMLFLMLISFYTSRVVLKALGTDDFGIYNVVGGVVVLFSFINSAMTTGTQRHISYALGEPNGEISSVYSACFNIHIWLSLLIVVLSESVGLWFLNNKLVFPIERITAVNWVYQLSIISCILSIIRVPFNAVIVAYEKMSFYAYIGIIEGILKLAIVYLLDFSSYDRLIFYAFLMTVVVAITTFIYYAYCRQYFNDIHYIGIVNKQLYKKILNFSGWTLLGSLANMVRIQAVTFIVNIFYGVAVNAAIGIANQVNAGISQFVIGFQQAFYPQLTKVEATKNRHYQVNLINMTAKYSYLVLLFCSLPILYNLDYILTFWLDDYPPYSKEFCQWIVIASLIDSLSGPLWVTIFATGSIKHYQIIISSLYLMVLPFSYVIGRMNIEAYNIFVFQALLNFIAIFIRLIMMRSFIQFRISQFSKEVFFPIALSTLAMIPILYFMAFFYRYADSITTFIVQSLIIVLYEFIIITFIGISGSERAAILSYLKSKLF